MDPLVRYASTKPGALPTSLAATDAYVRGHLQSAAEAGDLREVMGYLGRNGEVIPMYHDPEIWLELGLTEKELREGIVPSDLLRNLQQGQDRLRHQLGRNNRGGFRRPKELLITIPCEISEQLARMGTGYGLQLLEQLAGKAIAQLAAACVKRSRGGRGCKDRFTWEQGRIPALVFVHATERTGRPHHHAHILLFPQAKCADGKWRAIDTHRHCVHLQQEGGRYDLGKAIKRQMADWGVEVTYQPGLARDGHSGEHGATVTSERYPEIKAGTTTRPRRSQIQAYQSIRRSLGLPPPTHHELEWVRRNLGQSFDGTRLVRGLHRRDLRQKLKSFGLLDPSGRIVGSEAFHHRLLVLERQLASIPIGVGLNNRNPYRLAVRHQLRIIRGLADPSPFFDRQPDRGEFHGTRRTIPEPIATPQVRREHLLSAIAQIISRSRKPMGGEAAAQTGDRMGEGTFHRGLGSLDPIPQSDPHDVWPWGAGTVERTVGDDAGIHRGHGKSGKGLS